MRSTLRSAAVGLVLVGVLVVVPAPAGLAQVLPPPPTDSDGDGVIDAFDALPEDPTLWRPDVVASDDAVASGALVVADWDPVSGTGRLVLVQSWGAVWVLPLTDATVVGTSEHSLTAVGVALLVDADGSLSVRRTAAILVGSPSVARVGVALENPTVPEVPVLFHGPVAQGSLQIQNR